MRVCVNPECEYALICNEANCDNCAKKHLNCLSTSLEGITGRLNDGVNRYNEFVQRVKQIENFFLTQMQENRSALTKKYYLGSLDGQYISSIDKVYKKRD